MLFFNFLQPLRLQNLQSSIQSCVSLKLKLKICALLLTSFRLLCGKNAFRKRAARWSNKSSASYCCTRSETKIFLITIWAILQTNKWHEINTVECVYFYFLYPCTAHLHEIGASCFTVLNLEYFAASRRWIFFL